MGFDEVVVLLITQCLNRRGVETAGALAQRQGDRKFADDGFTSTSRRAHEHAVAVVDGLATLDLEVIQGVRQGAGELVQMRQCHKNPGYLPSVTAAQSVTAARGETRSVPLPGRL